MRRLALLLVAAMSLAVVGQAVAHPDEKGEVYVPWMDRVDGKRLVRSFMGDDAQLQANAAPSAPGTSGMTLVGNTDKDGTINSDLAFWGNLAYAGNYDGFRILNISGAQPQVVVDHKCRGRRTTSRSTRWAASASCSSRLTPLRPRRTARAPTRRS